MYNTWSVSWFVRSEPSPLASVVQVGEVQGDWCTQQLPSAAIQFFCPSYTGARITNKQMGICNVMAEINTYYTPCTRHSFPLSPGRETHEGVPAWPQSPSGTVFVCHFTGGPLGLMRPLPSQRPVECGCRSGSPAWGLEPVAVALAHQDGATVGYVGPVVLVSLSHPFPAILAGLVGCGSG